jgi:hypothetical protein
MGWARATDMPVAFGRVSRHARHWMTVGGVPSQNSAPVPTKPMDPRTPAFVLCVCAVVSLVATFSKNWASAGRGIGIGPTGMEACLGSVCRDIAWRNISGGIQVLAVLSLLAGIAAAGACAAFGGLFLANKHDKIPAVRLGNLVLGVAAGVMAVFEIRILAEGQISISWAVFPALASVVTAGVMLRKLEPHVVRPVPRAAVPSVALPIATTLPSAPQFQAPPSCPRCGTRLSFVTDKQRWFCVRDQEYV